MQATAFSHPLSRKRPVNLTLTEGLVAEAKSFSANRSATVETLLADYVAREQQARLNRQQLADVCAADWNTFSATSSDKSWRNLMYTGTSER